MTELIAIDVGGAHARFAPRRRRPVRELESVRNFLTSNAVTVVTDLFFTIVFFAVMYLDSPL